MTQRLFGVAAAVALAIVVATPAHARTSNKNQKQQIYNVECFRDCGDTYASAKARTTKVRASKKTKVAKSKGKSREKSVSLGGVVAPLASKAREIMRDCGSVVVSAVSRRGNRSNHPRGRAVDLQGNPRCIYAHLKKWPGGVSTDYASAPGGPHVHISYNPGGQEWGLRFAHRKPNKMFAAYVDRRN